MATPSRQDAAVMNGTLDPEAVRYLFIYLVIFFILTLLYIIVYYYYHGVYCICGRWWLSLAYLEVVYVIKASDAHRPRPSRHLDRQSPALLFLHDVNLLYTQ